jgi:hypothetical protein
MNSQQLLETYLHSEDSAADIQREALSQSVRVLVQRSLAKRETGDLEDFEEDCVLMIWTRITAIKSGAVEGSIDNIEAFVRQAVHNRYCDAIRRKRPKWYNLKLELMETFSGKTGVKGFAMWQDPESGGRILGYADWDGRKASGSSRCRELMENAGAFKLRHLQNRDPNELPLYGLAAAILDYCGGAVEVDVLTSCCAELLQARREEPLSIDAQPDPDSDAGAPLEWLISPDTPVEQQVVDSYWFEHVVDWFWKEFEQLAPRQRKALIYGMGGDQVMALAGIVGFAQMAESVEMQVQEFAVFVKRLPIPDAVTAEELGIEPKAVPSVRFKAWGRIRRRTRKSALHTEE